MKSLIDQKMKEVRIENSSEIFKKDYRLKTLETVFNDLGNKENRYIFYCPDITLVNSLVKLIYETAYEAYNSGFNVLILHEINGFKCKWLLENEAYTHLKELPVDYVIKQKSSKSKKTKAQYSFKPADTLIVPDQFQEMLDNLIDVKILQKVVLVSSYSGLSSLQPGVDYKALGVDKLLFTEERLKEDYKSLFTVDALALTNYPVNTDFFHGRIDKEVVPIISVSNIGNNDFVQQVINVFYNKYPNLRVFSFRVLDRDSLELYRENLRKAALLLVLDKTLASSQMINEALAMGCPVGTFKRTELNPELLENIYMGDTAFEIAENLAMFCQAWLNNDTSVFTEGVLKLSKGTHTYLDFEDQVVKAVETLREERISYFSRVKDSVLNATT